MPPVFLLCGGRAERTLDVAEVYACFHTGTNLVRTCFLTFHFSWKGKAVCPLVMGSCVGQSELENCVSESHFRNCKTVLVSSRQVV